MNVFTNLHPEKIWHYFSEIVCVPRPSKKEQKIINYLVKFAEEQKLQYKVDAAGNIIIYKPAAKGLENKETVILQSHVDMVCEKNADTHHDFLSDPIIPYVDGDWVKAKGTTLGADDGIGVAAMMAVLSDNTLQHGPLECLFTVDEETGLTGAFELSPDVLTGKILINLDSEDEGELFIGCAGGKDTAITFPLELKREINSSDSSYLISVTGLRGGHSGDDIHRGYGNAIKIMSEILNDLAKQLSININRFEGGNLRNAIPREAFAAIKVSGADKPEILKYFETIQTNLPEKWKAVEPGLKISYDPVTDPEYYLEPGFQQKLLDALLECPNGVIAWSKEIKDLVETSTNLASIKFIEGKHIEITTSQRSASDSAKNEIAEKVAQVFKARGGEAIHSKGYPGWKPNTSSKLVKITANSYRSLFKQEPLVKAIHAGLECGLFLEKYPDLDMISFGPTIKGAHSPDERLHIPSVKKFWDLLIDVLQKV